jgi:hypothetical protein
MSLCGNSGMWFGGKDERKLYENIEIKTSEVSEYNGKTYHYRFVIGGRSAYNNLDKVGVDCYQDDYPSEYIGIISAKDLKSGKITEKDLVKKYDDFMQGL